MFKHVHVTVWLVTGCPNKKRLTLCLLITLPSSLLPSYSSHLTSSLLRNCSSTCPNKQSNNYHMLWCSYYKLYTLCSCIECIISEQVEKLKVTLREIKCLTLAAQNTASLIENIMESEVSSHLSVLLEYIIMNVVE